MEGEQHSLDRLRDMARNGEIERLYVQAPDRLACGAGLIILVEELQKSQVEVIFLVGGGDDSPEGKLLLGMQGIIGAYEKVKILERTRRGRDYWARNDVGRGRHVFRNVAGTALSFPCCDGRTARQVLDR